jgi:hypothetical protein
METSFESKRKSEKVINQNLKVSLLNTNVLQETDSLQNARSFIKNHFYGARIKRMKGSIYLTEKERNVPAAQFIVHEQQKSLTQQSSSSQKSKAPVINFA